MDFPKVAIAYKPTKTGDAIAGVLIVFNPEQNNTFVLNYTKSGNHIRNRDLNDLEKKHLPDAGQRVGRIDHGNNPIIPYPDNDSERLNLLVEEMYKRQNWRFVDQITEYLGWKVNHNEKLRLKILLSECADVENRPFGRSENLEFKLKGKTILSIADNGSYGAWKKSIFMNSFPKQCDLVMRFITLPENDNRAYNSEELGNELGIPIDTIELIAEKFYGLGFIHLSSTSGFYNFHVKSSAKLFVAEGKSFENSKENEGKSQNFFVGGDMINSAVGQDSFLENRPTLNPTPKATNEEKNTNKTEGFPIKFWKLISENKLIAGILTALILAAIYYIFFGIKPGSK